MKYIYALILLAILVIGYTQNKMVIDYQIKIAGNVDSAIDYAYNFELSKENIGYSDFIEISADVDSNGHFELLFDSYFTQDVSIEISEHYEFLIIHPGDSIFIDIKKNDNGQIQYIYSGSYASQNQIISNFQICYDSIVNYDSIYWNKKFYTGAEYKMYCRNIYNQLLDFKTDFFKKNSLSTEYKVWIENEIIGNYYNWLLIYPNDHCLMNSLSYKTGYNLDYFDFLDSIPKITEASLVNTEVSSRMPNLILGFYIQALVDSRNDWNPEIETRDSLILDEILNYANQDNLLAQIMLNQFINWDFISFDTIRYSKNLPLIDSLITEELYNNALKNRFAETKQILASHTISSKAQMIDWSNRDILSLLDTIKTNGKNKLIYIDVWATWCAPCRSAMPSSFNLQNRFKDEPVDFVYICVDSEKKNWTDLISKYGLGGFHYYLTKNQSKILRERLKIKGIPHYLFFDKKGNEIIVNDILYPDVAKKEIQKRLE